MFSAVVRQKFEMKEQVQGIKWKSSEPDKFQFKWNIQLHPQNEKQPSYVQAPFR